MVYNVRPRKRDEIKSVCKLTRVYIWLVPMPVVGDPHLICADLKALLNPVDFLWKWQVRIKKGRTCRESIE